MPVTALDRGQGTNRGTIYVNRIDECNGDPDVFVIRSRDNGATFTNYPVAVADFEVSDTITFGDYLGVDARDGRVAGVFPMVEGGKVVLAAAIFDFR